MAVMAVVAVKAVELAVMAVMAVMAVEAARSPSRSDGRGRIGVREEKKGEREGPGARLPARLDYATAPLGPEVPQYFTPLTVR